VKKENACQSFNINQNLTCIAQLKVAFRKFHAFVFILKKLNGLQQHY